MYIIRNIATNRHWDTDSKSEAMLYATLGVHFMSYLVYCPSKRGALECIPSDL